MCHLPAAMRRLASLALALLALEAALTLAPAAALPGQAAVCPEHSFSSTSSEESCVNACVSDQNCPHGTKCCTQNPCGRSCMVPLIVRVPKAGHCPQVEALPKPGPCTESSECSSDDQCDSNKKCCLSLCAMRCLEPIAGPPSVRGFPGTPAARNDC